LCPRSSKKRRKVLRTSLPVQFFGVNERLWR
jgi:hypothetical protein